MTSPHYTDGPVTIWHGDCLDVMRGMPDNSVDAVVTDPPYGLEFMGKEWDAPWETDPNVGKRWQTGMGEVTMADGATRLPRPSFEKNSNVKCRTCGKWRVSSNPCRCEKPDFPNVKAENMRAFQAWCEEWATEAYRLLKPGGFLAAFGGTRTYHRLTSGIEDAGFEIRDSIGYGHSLLAWAYGSGFPKSLNVSKALADLPTCSCSVTSSSSDRRSVIDASNPAGTVRAGARAEPGTVPLAGLPTDRASRVRANVSADASRRLPGVDALDIDGIGAPLPVVLRPSSVAGPAQRDEVPGVVRGVEVDPEPLRDQMVGELGGSAAVPAGDVAADDLSGDAGPLPALVLPLASTPGGVIGTHEPVPVGDGHAVAGAVVGDVGPAAELGTADLADVDTVPGARHTAQDATERLSKCPACGGRRGRIPEGLGTALKPAWEPIVLARKPLSGTVAQTVLQYGTGALNIDGSRIGTGGGTRGTNYAKTGLLGIGGKADIEQLDAGRWPANVVLDASQAAALDQQSGFSTSPTTTGRGASAKASSMVGTLGAQGTVPAPGDSGGASRFFKTVDTASPRFMYTAKAGSDERPGVDGVSHPTVKPVDLMRWLVKLVTPPGGVVLEPFAGSGTTVEAAVLEGFRCVAIEREGDYLPLILQRVRKPHAVGLDLDWDAPTPVPTPIRPAAGRTAPRSTAPAPHPGFDFGDDWELDA